MSTKKHSMQRSTQLRPDEIAVLLEMNRGFVSFIDRCTIPVFSARPERQIPVGSGMLFEVCGTHYIVTAAHVAELCTEGKLALPLDPSFRSITTVGLHDMYRAARSEHDVALIALRDPQTVERLRASWVFLNRNFLSSPGSDGPYLVHGYPEPSHPKPVGLTQPGKRLCFATGRFHGEIEGCAGPFDPNNDLLLVLDPTSRTFESEAPLPSPRFNGVSGGSVWELVPERPGSVWTPTSQLRLVGIQSAAVHHRYIRVKRWHLLWSAFRADNPGAGAAVRSAISSSIRSRSTGGTSARRPPTE